MHIPPLLPVSMTMLALSGAALSLPIPTTPQEGPSSLDMYLASASRADDSQTPIHPPPRSPSPVRLLSLVIERGYYTYNLGCLLMNASIQPSMIQVFDPAGEIKEVIQTGPERTGRRSRGRVSPYDKSKKPRKPKGREEDAVKQADRLALDLAGLKLSSRTQS